MMGEAAFLGKWESTKLENWGQFMKSMEVGFVTRKAGEYATTYFEVTQEGDTITWKWQISVKKGEPKFQFGVEFEEYTPDGRTVKSTNWMEGDTWKTVQKGKPHDVTITRTLEDDGNTMIEIAEINGLGVQCKRWYKRTG